MNLGLWGRLRDDGALVLESRSWDTYISANVNHVPA